MKTKEDVLKTALDGVTDKWASIENMFASRMNGIWRNGYEHGRKETLELLTTDECVTKLKETGRLDIYYDRVKAQGFEEGYEKGLADAKAEIASTPVTVGDEVRHIDSGRTFVVTKAKDGWVNGFNIYGDQFADKSMKNWEKTGRHFDQVAELLKVMAE